MKRQEHKIEIQRSVLEVSRNLFLNKGYSKTTIKEITQAAGITTGSLYHFFKGKEDILRHLTQEIFASAASLSDFVLKEDADPCRRFSLEVGLQFYFIHKYKPIAELYLAAHESAEIAALMARSAQDRNQKLFQARCPDFTTDDHHAVALAIKGIIHSYIQESVYNTQSISTELMFRAIEMSLALYRIPEKEIEKAIQATHALIQKAVVKLYGFEVP